MLIALTGATGYTGGRLMRTLAARGHRLNVLVRSESVAGFCPPAGVEVVEGDLRRSPPFRRLVHGADVVIHVAAVYRTAGHPDDYYRGVNVEGTRRLLKAAVRAGVRRFIHTSTAGVHGHVEHPPATEDAPISPGDIYQRTKAEGEDVVLTFPADRMAVLVLRPAAIYGPDDTRHLKLFRAIARRRYGIVGSGEALHHLVYIDDLMDAYERAMASALSGEAFIIAGPEYTTQTELAATIARATGGRVLPWRIPVSPVRWAAALTERLCVPLGIEPPIHPRRVAFWTKSRAFSTAKALRLLDWTPRISLEEGIARTAAAYRAQGWL